MNKIAVYLNNHLTGTVFDKESILEAYSTDLSPLKVKPRLVAIPETTSDIRKLVRFASQLTEKKYALPISVRGSGLCKTGADLSSGLVISTEKFTRVRELDSHDRLVHVQAGITLGRLNAILAPHGLTLPVRANPNETIGSLISNAPIDDYSGKFGGIMNYVDRLEVVLSNGELIQTSRLGLSKFADKRSEKSFEGEIYKKLNTLITENFEQILSQPDNTRVGYPALKHVKRNHGHVFDLMPAFLGAEGSLGVITEVILRLEVLPPREHRILAVFGTMKSAREFMDYCLKLEPLTVEIFDTRIFKATEEVGKKPNLLTRKLEDGFAVLVSFAEKHRKAHKKVQKALGFLPKSAYVVSETTKNTGDFEEFKSCLSCYINNAPKGDRPNLFNDFSMPNNHLEGFLEGLKVLTKNYKKSLEIYGCYATGIYSVRPDFDLSKVSERRTLLELLRDFNELVISLGGSLAGGTPEGRLKSIVIYPELKSEDKTIISGVKSIFDKNNVFAPEAKSNYDTRSAVKHLRVEPNLGLE
ncbi:FAD-binding oxidoreductase [Candidatus Saccharibacteria bacterium]|nr:FAD-binding oxidoreductase [Candidatus Saccharibacteria bacterium]